MMAWHNSVELSGIAVRDAQRKSERGPWRFVLRQKGGKKRDGSFWPDQFYDCATFHASGSEVKHATEVKVRGILRDERWTDADGGEHKRMTIIAAEVVLPAEPSVESAPAAKAKTQPPITPRFPIPQHAPRQMKVAKARPITAADPISDLDVPF